MTIRILSHNTYWFQGHPFDTDRPGDPHPEVFGALMNLYQERKPDILCLQEIQSGATALQLRDALGKEVCFTPGDELPAYGGVLAWNKQRLELQSFADSRTTNAGAQRMWQAAEFHDRSGGGHFTVINIHLPSARQLPAAKAVERRLEELQTVLGHAPAADVLCGDFNERPGGKTGACLETAQFIDCAVLKQAQEKPTNVRDKRGDFLWIRGTRQQGLLNYDVTSLDNFACTKTGKSTLSDHLPLWIDVDFPSAK